MDAFLGIDVEEERTYRASRPGLVVGLCVHSDDGMLAQYRWSACLTGLYLVVRIACAGRCIPLFHLLIEARRCVVSFLFFVPALPCAHANAPSSTGVSCSELPSPAISRIMITDSGFVVSLHSPSTLIAALSGATADNNTVLVPPADSALIICTCINHLFYATRVRCSPPFGNWSCSTLAYSLAMQHCQDFVARTCRAVCVRGVLNSS